jgi:hypothetical protein
MKSIINTIIIFLIAFNIGCNRSSYYSVTSKSNGILYIGVQNSITIHPNNKGNFKLDIENGRISKIDKLTYVIEVDNLNPTYIFIKEKNRIDTFQFRNRQIP